MNGTIVTPAEVCVVEGTLFQTARAAISIALKTSGARGDGGLGVGVPIGATAI